MFLGIPLKFAVLTGLSVLLILMLINVLAVRFFGPTVGYFSVPVIVFFIGFFMWARQISKTDPWALLQRLHRQRQRFGLPKGHVQRWQGVSYAPSEVCDWSKK